MTSVAIEIGSPVACSDRSCGTVLRIVIDSVAGVITHLAVGPRNGGGRLVPFECVTSVGQEIQLNCTKAEFDAFLPDQDAEVLSDAARAYANQQADMFTLALYDQTAPGGIARLMIGADKAPKTRSFDRVPAGEDELRPSEQVKATDGPVGRVSGLGVDLATRRITHVRADAGHLWAKRTVAIPIEAVEHIGISVQLGLTQQQVRELGQP